MKNFIRKIILILFVSLSILLISSPASAFSLFPGEPSVSGGSVDYREYIVNFYLFALPATALVAVVLIMIGGIIWITSAGSQTRIAKAKEFIINAIIGLVILSGVYVILGFINPALVILQPVTIDDLGTFGACTFTEKDKLTCRITEKNNCTRDLKGSFAEGGACQSESALALRQKCEEVVIQTNSPAECNLKCAQQGGGACRGRIIENGTCPCHLGAAVKGSAEQQATDERLNEIVQSKSEEQVREETCQNQSQVLTSAQVPALPEIVWGDDCSTWCGNAPSFGDRSCRINPDGSSCLASTTFGGCSRINCSCSLR